MYMPVTGLNPSTSYYFTVAAVNNIGNSRPAAEASATIPAIAPSAPTSLTASTASYNQINLSWS